MVFAPLLAPWEDLRAQVPDDNRNSPGVDGRRGTRRRKRRSASLVDLRWRGSRPRRAQEGPRKQRHLLDRHARRRRRRHGGHDRPARPGHLRQRRRRQCRCSASTSWTGPRKASLGNLDEIAAKENWDKVVPTALQQFSKYDGHWIAAPVNVHSTNWMWINKAALDKAGGKEPQNWDELIVAARQLQGAGHHPGRPWRTALAGRHHLRRRRAFARRRLLQGGLHRPRSGGAWAATR